MSRPQRYARWHEVAAHAPGRMVEPRTRLAVLVCGFVLAAAGIFVRVAVMVVRDGAAYREAAYRFPERKSSVAGARGRILTRDGSVLARDRQAAALAVHFRLLEDPPDASWLRQRARAALSREQRRDRQQVLQMEQLLRVEREETVRRLAALCGISTEQFRQRAARIQRRVHAIRDRVNDHHRAARQERAAQSHHPQERRGGVAAAIRRLVALLADESDTAVTSHITVAEELAYHVIALDLSVDAVSEIEGHPKDYPLAQVETRLVRDYPQGALAAHVVGYVGAGDGNSSLETSANRWIGKAGAERAMERYLAGQDGKRIQRTDHRGEVVSSEIAVEPVPGRDVILALDARLQRSAERLLDEAMVRRSSGLGEGPAGGAIVVMDVESGAVLASASAPRFDPRVFVERQRGGISQLLSDSRSPLLDRTIQMAIPPGSVFKIVSAIALLESGRVDPDAVFDCQGYLQRPDRERCNLFARYGIGHGQTSMVEALARSCNVYFYHHSTVVGEETILAWARRLGLGAPSGIDLPGEAAGSLPRPVRATGGDEPVWRDVDTRALAIGQSTLLVTPLQVVRLTAAIANGGRMVTPHVLSHVQWVEGRESEWDGEDNASEATDGLLAAGDLSQESLHTIREGLLSCVAHADGTARSTVHLDDVSIAGKTGTAQVGRAVGDHAWFTGYAPAQRPRVALVVVLEHGGGGTTAAGPVAKRLVRRLDELGYFARRRVAER